MLLGADGTMLMDKREKFSFFCLRRMTTKDIDSKLPKSKVGEGTAKEQLTSLKRVQVSWIERITS